MPINVKRKDSNKNISKENLNTFPSNIFEYILIFLVYWNKLTIFVIVILMFKNLIVAGI